MRLIDANDVKKRGDCYLPDVRKVISNILSHTKTVKDAVVIVRCKDCKHCDSHNHRCKVWNHGINVEDFCSRGERKEE